MYLKAIEVHGFKSFANRMRFDFEPGVTCIVGPNGSGKSNVADAVRWVLGEQSAKQLRGANMQDVIFAGTENRKPLGYASVAITLDNQDRSLPIDFEEVTIARKLYRSGESEYRLNGAVCRLKDINELFYDTGIGKEGYSIIGQGQIDRILSNRPEERRELFDEAAGIVKFKKRKNVAMKKLQEEQQNLTRVRDILQELERQIGPLQKQAQTAEQYLGLKRELQDYDINVFLREKETGEEELFGLEQEISDLEKEQQQKLAQKESLRLSYEAVQEQMDELQKQTEQTQEAYNQTRLQMQGTQGKIQVLSEQMNTEYTNREHIQHRLEQIDAENAERKQELLRLDEERKTLLGQLGQIRSRFSSSQASLDANTEQIARLSDDIDQRKSKMIELLNAKSTYAAQFQRYETILEQNRTRKTQLEGWIEENRQQCAGQAKELERINQEQIHLKEQAESLDKQASYERDWIGQQEKTLRERERILSQMRQQYHQVFSRAESLRNLAERYEGYGTSVRRVMEQKATRKGIYGAVADILSTKKEYETAVETALGGSIQNIVTDTEKTAKELIQYLKRNQFGRATFLPLDAVRNEKKWNNAAVLQEEGIIGVASELVQTEPIFLPLVSFLLGRVIVARDIESALSLARKYHYSYRIVTLEGELLTPGGAMTGGAYKNASNLLGRRREIEELEQKTLQQSKKCRKEEVSLRQAQEALEEKRQHLEEIHRQQQQVQLKQVEIQLTYRQLQKELESVQEGEADWKRELRQLESQIEAFERQRSTMNQSIDQIEEQNARTEQQLLQMNISLEEKKSQTKRVQEQYSELQIKSNSMQKQDTFLVDNMTRIRNEREKYYQEKKRLNLQLEDSKEIEQEKKDEIVQLQQFAQQQQEQSAQQERQMADLRDKKEKCAAQQKTFFSQREQVTSQLAELDKKLFRMNGKREKLEERLDHQTEYLWNEYEIGPNEAEQYYREDLGDLEKLRDMAQTIQNRMKRLGHINMDAIEQCKQEQERYDFMKSQYDDLMDSVQSLQAVVQGLEDGMRKQFRETFVQIQSGFNQVFQELFGGGQGSLELMEDGDEIEAGIRIVAQPPGKKLQNMMQLSGGEKALTAISLLFAIQRLKPSPFCLLDEIEAALDDSNVGRFAEYLHRLTNSTQFIIITHKRDTMASAERLYGVTMQEKGVSALVSVTLIDGLD